MQKSRAKRVLETIGANVAQLRKRRGWTQADLTEAIEATEIRTVQRIERAECNFGVVLLVELADALDVSITDLLRPTNVEPARKGRPPAGRNQKKVPTLRKPSGE